MAKERLKSPRARLFVALDLPDEMREGVVAWGRRELVDPALRAVPPESLHVTLAFLGYLPEKEIGRLGGDRRGLRGAGAADRLRRPGRQARARQPRLFALPADSPGAVALQAELEEKLVADAALRAGEAALLAARDRRQGTPEGARIEATGARRAARRERCRRPLAALRWPSGSTLYRSELQPQGAQYTPLAQVELPKGQQ